MSTVSNLKSRIRTIAVCLALFAAGALGLVYDLAILPAQSGYLTTRTSVQTFTEVTRVWKSGSAYVFGLFLLVVSAMVMVFSFQELLGRWKK